MGRSLFCSVQTGKRLRHLQSRSPQMNWLNPGTELTTSSTT